MLVQHSRPRNVRWYLAAPMLFGDIGTSRLYVLGLAIFYAGTAAPYYVASISLLILGVAWGYSIICRTHPDGGGVYSSGRAIHPALGLIGAVLLFTDYVVTAAISTYEAMIYIGSPLAIPREAAPWLSVLAIAAIGALNYVGPRRAGTFALVVAVACIAVTLTLALATAGYLPAGWRGITPPTGGVGERWVNFVNVVLALSGIEAIASMTGIMVEPVRRTSRWAIWPVAAEVITLNVVLIIIVCSLPGLADVGIMAHKDPAALTEHEHALSERVLDVLARQYVGVGFAAVASVLFGLLLLSATNTAVLGIVNIQYAMARDRELPDWFSRLNSFGVPAWALLAACALPALIVLLAGSVQILAAMYAIGVVGAIVINLGACAYDQKTDIAPPERAAMWTLAGLMLIIWATVAVTKLVALLFLMLVLCGGLVLRFVGRRVLVPTPALTPAPATPAAAVAAAELPPLPAFDIARGRILVATRGNLSLLRFAFQQAKQANANLFVLYVRQIAVLYPGQAAPLTPGEDPEASQTFGVAEQYSREFGVPMQPIYSVSQNPADVILDFAATYAADQVILGVSRRTAILRALRGDVISGVADNLPAESTLLIHA